MRKGKLVCLCLSVLLLTACKPVENGSRSTTKSTDLKQSQSEKAVTSDSSSSSTSEVSTSTSTSSSSSSPYEKESQASATGMNLEAIQSGDFSSIKGTWKNGRDDTLIFGEDNRITLDGYAMFYQGVLPGNDVAINVTGDGAGSGATMKFATPGTSFVFGPAADVSDRSKERIWVGQGYSKDPTEFYYKAE